MSRFALAPFAEMNSHLSRVPAMEHRPSAQLLTLETLMRLKLGWAKPPENLVALILLSLMVSFIDTLLFS